MEISKKSLIMYFLSLIYLLYRVLFLQKIAHKIIKCKWKVCRAIWLIVERAQPIWTSWVQFEERVGLYNFLLKHFEKILWWQDWIHRSFLNGRDFMTKLHFYIVNTYTYGTDVKLTSMLLKNLTLGRMKKETKFFVEEWLKISTFLSSNQKGMMELHYVIR